MSEYICLGINVEDSGLILDLCDMDSLPFCAKFGLSVTVFFRVTINCVIGEFNIEWVFIGQESNNGLKLL